MNIWEKIKYEYQKDNSAVKQIIIINLAVFTVLVLVGLVASLYNKKAGDIFSIFFLPSNLNDLIFQPWSIVTNIFFHGGFWHIFGNMLLLYFIGGIFEDFVKRETVWRIFLWGGIAGGLFYLLSMNIFPVFEEVVSYKKLLGASGGVTAILVAAAMHIPHYNLRPFGLFKIEMRWVAIFFIFRDLYTFPGSENMGGLLAHIGGAIFGALFVLNLQGKINFPSFELPKISKKKMKVVKKATGSKPGSNAKGGRPNQAEIDAILDKISQSGYDSLTSQEKDILFKASE